MPLYLPKARIENLADAILDPRVINGLVEALMPRISLSIETSIDKKLSELIIKVDALDKAYDVQRRRWEDLRRENIALRKL